MMRESSKDYTSEYLKIFSRSPCNATKLNSVVFFHVTENVSNNLDYKFL